MNRRSFLGGLAAFFGAAALAKVATSAPEVQTGTWNAETDGWVCGRSPRRGEVFTIAGVYAVNPLSYRVTDRLQRFVVTSDQVAGERTVRVSPPAITSGPLQTVECRGRWKPRAGQSMKFNFAPQRMPGTDEVPVNVISSWRGGATVREVESVLVWGRA